MKSTADNLQASFALKVLVGLAAAGVVLYFMSHWSNLINNLFIAYILAIIAAPLLIWLRRKGFPDWLSFLLTLLVVAVASLVTIAFILFAASRLSRSIPTYVTQLDSLRANLDAVLTTFGLSEEDLSSLLDLVDLRQVLDTLGAVLSAGANVLSHAAMIILFVVFMLVQVFTTPLLVRREIETGNAVMRRILRYNMDLRQYMLITAAIAVVTGAMDTVLFFFLRIPDPLVWGIVAAILSFVPTIGFWLAAIPPSLLAFLIHGPALALVTFVGIVLINGFADNVIKPRYIGGGLDMAPFLVIFSVVFWAMILGPVGAILGVPMTMLIKSLFFEADESLSWIARVTGSGSAARTGKQELAETAVSQNVADIE
jgi:AI-2 transport protein TqsA